MRVVLDTNIWVSLALDRTGNFARLVEELNRTGIIFVSSFILRELEGVLKKIEWGNEARRADFIEYVAGTTWDAGSHTHIPQILEDKPDNHILACGVDAKADVIVTGDKAFLTLKNYKGIEIISPAKLAKRLRYE